MYISHNQVRMHDTDMAGILYFARQFRFAHDAIEDFFESEGYSFEKIFQQKEFVFVIAHAEADYLAPLNVSDKLEVHVEVERIGTTSFTFVFKIYRSDSTLVGTAKTVHVCLGKVSRKSTPLSEPIRSLLSKHLVK